MAPRDEPRFRAEKLARPLASQLTKVSQSARVQVVVRVDRPVIVCSATVIADNVMPFGDSSLLDE